MPKLSIANPLFFSKNFVLRIFWLFILFNFSFLFSKDITLKDSAFIYVKGDAMIVIADMDSPEGKRITIVSKDFEERSKKESKIEKQAGKTIQELAKSKVPKIKNQQPKPVEYVFKNKLPMSNDQMTAGGKVKSLSFSPRTEDLVGTKIIFTFSPKKIFVEKKIQNSKYSFHILQKLSYFFAVRPPPYFFS